MFDAKLSQAGIFKKVLDAVRDLVSSANFECTATGFGLHAIDASHVALVSLLLREDAFEQFRCDKNRSLGLFPLQMQDLSDQECVILGMSVTNLVKVLKCCENDDTLTIKADETQDKVILCIESQDAYKESKFELSLMEILAEKLTIPKSSYPVQISMPSVAFAKIVRDLSSIGDSIVISVTKRGVNFSTVGSIGKAEITCSPHKSDDMDTDDVTIEMTEAVSAQFAAKYLSSFCKATPLSERVVLRLAPERPIAVQYHIEDMGHIIYYLAPKIEDEDEDMDDDE